MPRPTNEKPTLTAFCRGSKPIKPVYIRYSYRGIRHQGIAVPDTAVDPQHLSKDNFVKTGKPGYLEANRAIEEVLDCILQAHDTLVDKKVPFTAVALSALVSELLNKIKETKIANAAEEARKAHNARFNSSLDSAKKIVEIGSIPEDELAIEKLERELAKKKRELAAIKKKHSVDYGDKLTDWLHNYMKRNGVGTTLSASTIRTQTSFINTVAQFDADARIGDVDDQWLIKFQQWLNTTPSRTPIYKQVANPMTEKRENGELIRYQIGRVRSNDTVENYVSKIKTMLNYYDAYSDLLPEGITVNPKYKRYKFSLQKKNDQVFPLSEAEILEVMQMEGFSKAKERARLMLLFLCATSFRFSDGSTITSDDIEDGYINKYTQKGKKQGVQVYVPLNPVSEYVLNRCNFDIPSIAMEDDDTNKYIAEICKELSSMHKKVTIITPVGGEEIKETRWKYECITTHCGRRSHINILLDYRTPLPVVMSITGHTNLKTLQSYVDKRKKKVVEHTLNIFNLPIYNKSY
ncbi:tyrosine-type recombinase/integrase [Hymenobacter endophyticus]|uniref:Tyrosine-type recombinase/integrase n=1 Tax=Hymenobacter endophyticus TaxID=3076335 RepID=A0ABU3TCJ2_9BACT|nr:tyrosine-type recombinase/integrase [Hymenobacter endophyticus]MDU0369086.1 tyrosine-type recombinase/integrase [Hymenobacter endophyticus]